MPSVPPKIPLVSYLALCQRICLPTSLIKERTRPTVRTLNVLRHPIVIVLGGAGIFNLLSIAYAFRPQLRDRLTQGRRALPWKPWVYGDKDFHLICRLLIPCIFASMRSSTPYGIPSTHILHSPTTHTKVCIRDFGSIFSPGYFRRKISRLVSCYALFK